MTVPSEEVEFRQRLQQLESLLQDVEGSVAPAARARIRDIVQTLLEFHELGLARILDHLARAGEAGKSTLEAIGHDDLAGSLLVLHGLHPFDVETRVRQALDQVRPKLNSQGGDVELVSLREGRVRLRITSNGHGCHSTMAKLKQAVEDALCVKAPDLTAIQIDGATDGAAESPAAFIPVEQLLVRQ